MSPSLINTLFLALAYLLLFASAEYLYHKRAWKAEQSRKYVHVVTGLLSLLFPLLINNHWLVLILCASFFVILILSLRFDLLKSINAVERKTHGSLLYPLAVYLSYLLYDAKEELMVYYIPVLILAIADPMATVGGKYFAIKQYKIFGHCKSIGGALAFFSTALLICIVLALLTAFPLTANSLGIFVGIAFATCLAEAVAHNGLDNISIPIAALIILYFTF